LAEVKALGESYNRARIITDQFAAEPVRQGLNALGCSVEYSPWTNDF